MSPPVGFDWVTAGLASSAHTRTQKWSPAVKGGFTAWATSAAPERQPLYAGQFEIPIAAMPTTGKRESRHIHELNKEKKAIMLAAEFDHEAFGAVQDELDYAYAVKADKEKKRAARARTRGIKALNAFIAQALLRK